MKALILTTSGNVHSDKIQKLTNELGVNTVRINFDTILENDTIFISNSDLIVAGKKESVRSVFVHHPDISFDESLGFDELDIQLVRSQWLNWISNAPALLPSAVKWVNNPNSMKMSSPTVYQLKVAKSVGFKTPNTCITNDLQELKKFARVNNLLILKPGNLPGFKPKNQRLLANIVNVDDIDEEQIRSAPCLFQSYIEKKFELRVHVAGNQVLACRIDSQASDATKTDWRNYDLKHTPHYVYDLDSETSERCVAVSKSLGYELGIIDLIVTPQDEIVFLECNSQGHWLWIEELTGLAISEMIAKHLIY